MAKPAITEAPENSVYARIYAQVCAVPAGRVTTYGRVAKMVGCGPRQVGYAMASLPAGSRVPWQRVINHKGEISCRTHGRSRQRTRLRDEGVHLDQRGRVNLARYLWPPGE